MLDGTGITALFTRANATAVNISVLLLRLTIGITLFVVGAGKVLGWFGGYGLEPTLQMFEKMGIAAPLVYLSCFTEFLGGLALAVGFLTRPAAFAVTINMAVATVYSLPRGFLTGAALPFTFLVIAIVLLLVGPMTYSLDSVLFRKSARTGELSQKPQPSAPAR